MELHCTTGLWPPQPAQLPLSLGEPETQPGQRVSGTGSHTGQTWSRNKGPAQSPTPLPLQEGVRGWSDAEPGGLALSQAASDHGTAHLSLQKRPCQDPGRGCKVPEPRESRSSKLLASPSLSHVCWWKVSLLPGAVS